jgi:hypothetical protein
MLRDKFITHHRTLVDGFRWRSREVARIEGFSDAVFGFALTLLIVSLEVPKTSTELMETMHGFLAFVLTFLMLSSIWYAQFLYFRRYGIEDRVTVVLNLILLFTVLFFVYPLKFLFGVMTTDPTMRRAKVLTSHGLVPAVLPEHRQMIFLIFGLGFGAVFIVFRLLYRHAYQKREDLGLNEFEVYETLHSMRRQAIAIYIAVTYVALAGVLSLPHETPRERLVAEVLNFLALFVFIGLFAWMFRMKRERKRYSKDWHSRQPEEELGPPS